MDRHESWNRQPGEGARPFAAFQMYRDQPPMQRSVRRLAETIGRNRTMVGRWSSQWRWVERAAAWDAEQDRLVQAANSEARQAFARRLAASGAVMQARGLGKVRSYVDRVDRDGHLTELREGQRYADELSVTEATRLIEIGARLEQIGRGLPSPEHEEPESTTFAVNPIVEAVTAHPDRLPQVAESIQRLMAVFMAESPMEIEPIGFNGAMDEDGTEVRRK